MHDSGSVLWSKSVKFRYCSDKDFNLTEVKLVKMFVIADYGFFIYYVCASISPCIWMHTLMLSDNVCSYIKCISLKNYIKYCLTYLHCNANEVKKEFIPSYVRVLTTRLCREAGLLYQL